MFWTERQLDLSIFSILQRTSLLNFLLTLELLTLFIVRPFYSNTSNVKTDINKKHPFRSYSLLTSIVVFKIKNQQFITWNVYHNHRWSINKSFKKKHLMNIKSQIRKKIYRICATNTSLLLHFFQVLHTRVSFNEIVHSKPTRISLLFHYQ